MGTPRTALSRATTAELVADHLREEIQSGLRPPGSRLRQSEVAQQLGVSTTPVREAFALLQSDGLVRLDAHRGAVVFLPTSDELRELYEIREALATLAISRAIPQLTDAAIDQLGQIVREMEAAADKPRWDELHASFHRGIYAAAGRPRLLSMIRALDDAAGGVVPAFQPSGRHIMQEHQAIFEACRQRNLEETVRLTQEHMRYTLSGALDYLKSLEQPGRLAKPA